MIGASTLVYPQDAEKEEKEMGRKHRTEAIENLPGITEEQKSDLESLHKQTDESLKPLREQIKELHKQLDELRSQMNYDMEQMRRLTRESGQLHTEMRLKKLDQEEALRDILTQEQMQALLEHKKKAHEERKALHMKRKAEMKALMKERNQQRRYHKSHQGNKEEEAPKE